ncbi:flagellar protein G [Natronorubrum texcoconense]|uniref:Flagellar protein FlaG n=1 Tax=Natronorubrum texcoconense TaxID=1095776 RepID=A0A1G9F9P5_9EURY|nr:flagellar protein G [Natronorubrum texcoconense]SDK85142.1 flagellar protein FlaG [Natronorubrum texcoconense]
MSSESISSLILFIAAMLVAAAVAGTLVTTVTDVSGSIDTHSDGVKEQIDTDFEIISDPGSDAVYDDSSETVSVLVKNTGSTTLASDGSDLDLLVNGEYVTDQVRPEILDDDATSWRRGVVAELEIEVENGLASGEEHRVTVTVNGQTETLEFYVPQS